jgi:hypothetical protein
MPNSDITRLMNNARLHLPGAMDAAIQLELYNIIGDFCARTDVWQEEINITTVVGTTSYDVYPTGITELHRLLFVVDSNDLLRDAAMPMPGTVVLAREPEKVEVLTATFSLNVTDPVDRDGYVQFPQWIAGRYMDTLLAGVVGRMMAQPAKPYTNLPLASAQLRAYEAGKNAARVEVRKQNTRGTQTWRFPQQFATSRRGY